jgi:3-hydroxyacyl-CoA dehydrogenase
MDLDARLEKVTVLGAAGKMGSGIVLLLATEMAKQKLKPENKGKSYVLHAIDVSEDALSGLLSYLRAQLTKVAEKSIVEMRGTYADRADLVENYDIIAAFVEDALSVLRPSTSLESVAGSRLVFEAIIEDEKIKIDVLSKVDALCPDAYYLTNTSSIPIGILDEGVGLGGRIVGYHFYNPPAVQRLLELITTKSTKPAVAELGKELAKRLRKKVFPANDIAGFIGNGHFMRDILHATAEVKRLSSEMSVVEAIYVMNRVSQDLLVRPMGIFQLIDYVGVDVCRFIMTVMTEHISGETLKDDLLERMADAGVMGGQFASGAQKDGVLKYEKGRPAGVYDLAKGGYALFAEGDWTKKLDEKLGAMPDGHAPWRALLMDAKKGEKLAAYFGNLATSDTFGAVLARAYLVRSQEIGSKLVEDGVANSEDDVNGVLVNGFYHLYGPINEYVDLMVDKVGGTR